MATKQIFGFLSVIPDRSKPSNQIQTEVQAGNVFFRNVDRRRTIYFWDNNATNDPALYANPWKTASLLDDTDDTVGHGFVQIGRFGNYPIDPLSSTVISTKNIPKYRKTGVVGNIPSTNVPRVIGCLGAYDQVAVT